MGPSAEPVLKTARPLDAAARTVRRCARGSAVPSESSWCDEKDAVLSTFLPEARVAIPVKLRGRSSACYAVASGREPSSANGRGRHVYAFADGSSDMRDVLGGKGAELAEMTSHRPARSGRLHGHDRGLPRLPRRGEHVAGRARRSRSPSTSPRWRSAAGSALGDPADPLLVSVRSGSPVSMPGMMDTILNLGPEPAVGRGPRQASGNARFAADSYRRFVQMYANVVLGVSGDLFEEALTRAKSARGVARRRRPRRGRARASSSRSSCGSAVPRPAGSSRRTRASSSTARSRPCSRRGTRRGRARYRRARGHLRRPRHGRQRHADGVRQPGRRLGDRRRASRAIPPPASGSSSASSS